ncbi:MAG: DHHW family protein [Clostridiales bacterium]|nr:DHHW family protein [Clostridiales bacterium]
MRKYFISVLFILLLCASAILILAPPDTDSIANENRELKTFPEFSMENVWSGKFSSDFEGYVDDNIAFRGKLMNISDAIRSRLGYTDEGIGRIVVTSSDIGTGQSNEGRLVLYNNYIMEMFHKDEKSQTKYIEALNEIRNAVPDNIRMYSMLVPTALEFSDKAYSDAQDSQKEAIDFVYKGLKGIFPVDAYSALLQDNSDSLYFKTDHHWTTDGAYDAYRKYISMSGGDAVQKSDFTRKENGNFYGSLYLKAKSQLTEQVMDTIFYYDITEKNDVEIKMRAEDNVTEYGIGSPVFDLTKNNYLLFFGGDNPLMEITNKSNPDGKTVLVIKDSYANAFLPWLVASSGKVIVIDPRSFGGSLVEEVKRYNADEVLVLNYIFSATFDDYCDMIKKII